MFNPFGKAFDIIILQEVPLEKVNIGIIYLFGLSSLEFIS